MLMYSTDGQMLPRGNIIARGKRKFADYVLEWKPGIPLAILEAKDNNHSVGKRRSLPSAHVRLRRGRGVHPSQRLSLLWPSCGHRIRNAIACAVNAIMLLGWQRA
jgi:hypothetical protein